MAGRKKIVLAMAGIVGLMIWNHRSIHKDRQWLFLDGSEER